MKNTSFTPFQNVSNTLWQQNNITNSQQSKVKFLFENDKEPIKKMMYASSIQPTNLQNNSFPFSLNSLGSMGRQVKQQNQLTTEIDMKNNLTKPLTFNSKIKKANTMCHSVILPSQNQSSSALKQFKFTPKDELIKSNKFTLSKAKSVGLQLLNESQKNNYKFEQNKNIIQNKPLKQFNYFLKENQTKEIPVKQQYINLKQTVVFNQVSTQPGGFKKKNYAYDLQQGKTRKSLLQSIGIDVKSPRSNKIQIQKIYNPVPQYKVIEQKQQVKQKNTKFKKQDFAIGKKMGKGQFGQVMLVRHKLTGFICGMKIMSKKQIRQEKYQNQIARQLSIQFYLNHRNVGPLYGYFQDQQNVYLLVEFCCEGQLLQKLRKNRRMEQEQVSPIIRQICQGLDYIHKQNIIHRDIKPQNILFTFGTVKISDFGWAVYAQNGMRKTTSGSPLYYSPQIVKQDQYDQKSDLWAIGMMTYQCLIGKIPFKIYTELDLNRILSDQVTFPQYVDVTDEAKDFILGIMKKIPEQRMTMREILRHPFITKYLRSKAVDPAVIAQFKKMLML